MAKRFASSLTCALAGAAAFAAASLAPTAAFAEPASCLSPNPADWPPSSKPYFMLAADTSGSMTTTVGVATSCGYGSDRRAHLRCAIKNSVQAFSGEANFGLATYPRKQTGCGAACYGTCTYSDYPGNVTNAGCGPGTGANRRGAFIQVPMLQDSFWMSPPPANNTSQLLGWVDNNCSGNTELFADGSTPLNGLLRDMYRYYSNQWVAQDNSVTYVTPLASQDLAGSGVNGSTGCRSANVILITDGDETCDTQADAVNAAAQLYGTGVTVGGKLFKVRVFVINFAGGSTAATDQIANAGGTGASVLANNETDISVALANIIAGAAKPEVCDNVDNNCNGCTDEGFKHYCDQGQTCCAWATPAQRTACLTTYTGTITAANPSGDLTKLPCTTQAQQADPLNWLCYDPKESCDNVDNNCSGQVDEGINKCGNPLHCPQPEVCDGQDNDCDGLVDQGLPNCNPCVPSPEICDGCDNDCDGQIDEGIASLPCGLPSPPNCVGQVVCAQKNNPGGVIGACVAGGGNSMCSYTPGQEVCDNLDNDCDGIVDDGVPPTQCVPPGFPNNLDYGPNSQCKKGTKACGSNQCVGFVGPSAEVCDGIDNNCDGLVDNMVFGVGLPCGLNQPPCTPGTTACVNGTLVCQGGTGPKTEVCNGLDDNCNGIVDDGVADGPPAGMNGCWNIAGNCCTFKNLNWCPPPGGNCNDAGLLKPPCGAGTLACAGATGWVCQGSKGPAGETCDGLDNDCNGAVDDGALPGVGDICGIDTGECKTGIQVCTAGMLDCVGDIPPSPEVCDGLDNDCNGVVDNGIGVGGTCTPAYDPQQYPNPPVFPPCQPGTLVCSNGNAVCQGGVGPTPELCDGIDNDCDGMVDEAGTPPNGIDGTPDPIDPTKIIGQQCGVNMGMCTGGTYQCVSGTVVCVGGQQPKPEECDCKDNDCNGQVDEGDLCSAGKDCVTSSQGCLCAAPCDPGSEFPCPGGQKCVEGTVGGVAGHYCFPDACPNECVDAKTTDPGTGAVVCAPAGTPAGADCTTPPACVCQNASGCQNPCFNVTCTGGLVCTDYGPNAGKCVQDNCYNVPCKGCDSACHAGSCTDNPCEPNPCAANEECKPTPDFMGHTCVASCGDKTCSGNDVCVDGACVKGCGPCPNGQVCDMAQDPPACVATKCADGPVCADGSCCDPLTGNCGDCRCAGVACPAMQECHNDDGQCHPAASGTGGSAGASGSAGAGGGNATGSGGSSNGTGSGGRNNWGLASGGGGCSCRMSERDDAARYGLALGALALGMAVARRRRRRSSSTNA